MNADIDNSRSSRRPRPEVAVYRPGSGPLKKSTNNTENIQSSSSNRVTTPKAETKTDLVSSLRNISLNDEKKKDKSKLPDAAVTQEPKPRRFSAKKHERDACQPPTALQTSSNENSTSSSNKNAAIQMKRQNHLAGKKMPDTTGSNQDLRQLLIEKRLQKNKDSSSDDNNCTKTDVNHQQVSKAEYPVRNGSGSHPDKNSSASEAGYGKNSEKKNSRRKNEKKSHQVKSYEEFSPTKIESPTNHNSKLAEERNALNDFNKRNEKETLDHGKSSDNLPKGSRRRRRNNRQGGSRRGSVSSDRTTPVPDFSWAEDNRSERSLPPRPSSQQSFHRNRHSPSPHRSNSRNGRQLDNRSQAVSPSPFVRPAPPATPPPRQHHQEHSPPSVPQVLYE